MSGDKLNVVVVGGGIIGCGTAYYLARAGARVTLLERGPLASESSSAAAGLTGTSTREGPMLSMAQESLRLMQEAALELELDFDLRQRGTLILIRAEADLAKQKAFAERQQARGLDVRLVDPKTALEIEPAAAPDILAAVYSPIDYTASPYKATLTFGEGARRSGVAVRTGVEVTGLKAEGGRVRGVVTRDGQVATDVVVVAAGAWTPILTRTIGLDLPIEPSRGQIFITEPVPTLTSTTLRDTGHIYVVHTERGNYVIGSVTEKVGFNKRLSPEKLREYTHEGAELVPILRKVRVNRAWAGLRPLTADGNPILGRVEGYEGLAIAAGHSRLGILLSAVTAKMVADDLTTGKPAFPMEMFSAARFKAA